MFVVGLVGPVTSRIPTNPRPWDEVFTLITLEGFLRPKFFTPCLLFNCWTLAICLGTGQPKKKKVVNKINKIIKIASSHIS